jgi:hypothetical protein
LTKAKGSSAKRQAGIVWTAAGWQGMNVLLPDSWNMAAYGGDDKSGNVRWDNSDSNVDGIAGLEIRWNHTGKPMTDRDLERRIDQYFEGISREARKQKLNTETKSTPSPDEAHPERTASRSFVFRTDRKGVGRIWYCGECRRTVIAQVVIGLKTDIAVPRRVLDSLCCHSEDREWQPWSLYDLRTEIPSTYSLLRKPQLMNIYVQLAFQWGRSTDEITVEQWGVANVQLRGAYLDEWFREKSSPLLPVLRYEAEETTAHGHTALRITGKRTGPRYWIFDAWPQIQRLRRPSPYFEACLWECPETNKVHLIQTFTRRRRPELIEQIVERTRCHS